MLINLYPFCGVACTEQACFSVAVPQVLNHNSDPSLPKIRGYAVTCSNGIKWLILTEAEKLELVLVSEGSRMKEETKSGFSPTAFRLIRKTFAIDCRKVESDPSSFSILLSLPCTLCWLSTKITGVVKGRLSFFLTEINKC